MSLLFPHIIGNDGALVPDVKNIVWTMSPIIFPGSPVLPPTFPIFGGKPTGTQHNYSKPEKSTCPHNKLDLAISQVVARVLSFHFSNFQYPLSPKTTQFSSSCQVSPTPAGNGKDETTSGIIVNLFQKVLVNMIFFSLYTSLDRV